MTNTTIAQGEIYGRKIQSLPKGLEPCADPKTPEGAWIISHSESGHHHVIDAPGVTVMEGKAAPKGVRILYAIVERPASLRQDALNAHGAHALEPGIYEFRIAREHDPFTNQARRVAD